MCGRFTNRLTWREIVALYRLAVPVTPERNLPARYNICPTDTIDVVVERGGQVDLVPMRWGLIPSWWTRTAKEVPATFNARAETLAVKPMFRDALRRNRCFIPASGYYEWLKTPTGKQPYYYTARHGANADHGRSPTARSAVFSREHGAPVSVHASHLFSLFYFELDAQLCDSSASICFSLRFLIAPSKSRCSFSV
jgi:hypothetical protein